MKALIYFLISIVLMLIAFFGGKLWSDLMSKQSASQVINMHLNQADKSLDAKLDQIAKCQDEKMKVFASIENSKKIIKKINESLDREIAILKSK